MGGLSNWCRILAFKPAWIFGVLQVMMYIGSSFTTFLLCLKQAAQWGIQGWRWRCFAKSHKTLISIAVALAGDLNPECFFWTSIFEQKHGNQGSGCSLSKDGQPGLDWRSVLVELTDEVAPSRTPAPSSEAWLGFGHPTLRRAETDQWNSHFVSSFPGN